MEIFYKVLCKGKGDMNDTNISRDISTMPCSKSSEPNYLNIKEYFCNAAIKVLTTKMITNNNSEHIV
jgi:hypothetical protein